MKSLSALPPAALHAALAVRPVGQVLREVGFEPSQGSVLHDPDPDTLVWFGTHAGQRLKIFAGRGWFGQWTVTGTLVSSREALWDQRQLLDIMPAGEIVAKLVALWRDAFRQAPCPPAFALGLTFLEFQRLRSRLNPGVPQVQVDGPALRMVINRLRKDAAVGALSPTGTLWLTQVGAQLALMAEGGLQWMIPAQGHWVGVAVVELQVFLEWTPRRFHRRTVTVSCKGDVLTVDSRDMPAIWRDDAEC
ncbi:MAG: hypothetical protein KGL33_02055 [Betaproteobacteria bacterium]|nr:hypothetical protein [Betaproteobacteria bacterium]